MKLCIIYGTRPEYLKVYSLINSLKCKVIRIFQHTSIAEPDLIHDYSLTISSTNGNRLDSLGSQILSQLSKYIKDFTHVLVQGDTSTAFYSALCAFQNGVKIIHLEAGLRTYDIYAPYPEEAYRQMISRMAEIHLVPHKFNKHLLEQENVQGQIHVVGNTILDLVHSYNLKVNQGHTVLITFHRRENVEHLPNFVKHLKQICEENKDKEFIWFLHPNKELQNLIKSYNLNITFLEPCNHREFLEHVRNCFCILTDSGGIQEEAAFLGKPTIVLRKVTERDQIPFPYLQLVAPPYSQLKNAFTALPSNQLSPCYVYGEGNSTIQILNAVKYA